MNVDHSRIHKILVIKLRAIGDVLLSSVVLNNLRAAFPSARIDFLTETPSRGILEGHPALSSLVIFDPKNETGLDLVLRVRRERYDCVIDLFGNPRSAIVTLLSGARIRAGYRFGWRKFCYNIVAEPRGSRIHNRDFNLDVLALLDVPAGDTSLTIPVGAKAEEFAEAFFREHSLAGKTVVAVNAGGGWYTKRWGIRNFAALADRLAGEHGAEILVCWGPGEKDDALTVQNTMHHPARLIPPTSLQELAAILRRCSAMVTNDSGPMHIAAVMGTPVLAVFGPTNPRFQGPVGEGHVVVRNERLDCLGCNLTKCPIGLPCMEKLTVEEMVAGFGKLRLRSTRGDGT